MTEAKQPARRLRDEWRPTFALAWPVIIAEVGWMVMSIVDTFMVGGLGPEAIGAVSIGGAIHFTIVLLGTGLLLGLGPIVSQAFGANKLEEGRHALVQGLWLSVILTGPLMGIQWLLGDHLLDFGINPAVVPRAASYMKIMSWGTFPLIVFSAFRHYLQSIGIVRPVMIALVSANLVNWMGNYVLINGRMGFPRLDVDGSGWSTAIARLYMAAILGLATVLLEKGNKAAFWKLGWGIDFPRMMRVVNLGLPAALQIVLEVGVFAAATTLVGRMSAEALAAHQIVLNLSGLTFMVPLGIASAGSIRVGHEIGRNDPQGAILAGWAAIVLGVGVMAVPAMLMLLLPQTIAEIFTNDAGVIAYAKQLLLIVAAYQLFDGLQVVTTGSLRGTGDTRTAMITGLGAYWCIGLPVGAYLGLKAGFGVVGLWIGLSTGLILAGIVLLGMWMAKVRWLKGQGGRSERWDANNES